MMEEGIFFFFSFSPWRRDENKRALREKKKILKKKIKLIKKQKVIALCKQLTTLLPVVTCIILQS